jgi:phosphatidylcholine synthase
VTFAAALVHILTALGALCALLAMEAIGLRAWESMFGWLGVALFIDGVDGAFARLVSVNARLPRFSGERLDIVTDYLTYVFVPTVALLEGGLLEGRLGEVLAAAILLSSLYHFSDLNSKTHDLAFVGFPAIWNIVAFYLFVFGATVPGAAAVIVLCVGLTFVPIKCVHPLRVVAMRPLTLAMTTLWAVAGIAALWSGFGVAPWLAKAALLMAAAYFIGLSLAWSLIRRTHEGEGADFKGSHAHHDR